jgi:hypothetical protein
LVKFATNIKTMKLLAVSFIVSILAVFVGDSAFAQHFIQVDDGAGHVTILKSQTIDPLDIFNFPTGGGTLLVTPPPGTHSSVWQTAGNTGIGGSPSTPTDFFGTTNNFDVVMVANNVEKMRLVSGGGVSMSANLSAIRGVPYVWPAANGVGLLNNDGSGNLNWTSTPVLTLTNSHIFVGNSSNVATDVAMGGDVTISNTGVTAIGPNKVLDGMIRQGGATSVIGRSANSVGNVADIAAASDGQVLRRSGGVLGFGSIGTSSLTGGSNDNFLVWTGGAAAWQGLSLAAGGGISGNGVSAGLSLNIQHDASLAGAGTTASNLVLAVQHDASLSGAGSAASNLVLSVQHDGSLTGAGSAASNLTLNTANANSWTGQQSFGAVVLTPTNQNLASPGPINDLALSTTGSYFRVSSAGATTLTGFTGGVSGRMVTLLNVGTNPITLVHATGSGSGNQFDLPGGSNIILGPRGTITFIYEATVAPGFWEVYSTN